MGYRDSDDTGFSRHGMGSDHSEAQWRRHPAGPECSGDGCAAATRHSAPAMRIDYRAEGAYTPHEYQEHASPARRELERDTGAAAYSAADHRYQDYLRQRREFEAQHADSGSQRTRRAHAPAGRASLPRQDPDYLRWREEQLRQLDADYRAWRQERYEKFAEDFAAWRSARAKQAATEQRPAEPPHRA